MGSSFTNYHVRADDQKSVAAWLRRVNKAAAVVFPSQNGWVTVYDEASEFKDLPHHHKLLSKLSAELSTIAVFFLVHDDDESVFLLCDDGKLVDQFATEPSAYLIIRN